TDESRLQRRFYGEQAQLDALYAVMGKGLDADQAHTLGLNTRNPDDIDWQDESQLFELVERYGPRGFPKC
ncbi:MAG: hypothetical protein EBW39_02720, partial [Betaproteobacteria bacterium]|nr:hypothetical protein [Betaproteobacteria bacterium]